VVLVVRLGTTEFSLHGETLALLVFSLLETLALLAALSDPQEINHLHSVLDPSQAQTLSQPSPVLVQAQETQSNPMLLLQELALHLLPT
jgi:hypothetical protein